MATIEAKTESNSQKLATIKELAPILPTKTFSGISENINCLF
ncbi:hypothetical protein LV84_01147 [Algoriphagus ratkowskyi]|uniref:Uncharacterized protein n=1 Tax=Algoriphagus ratkowskyi TaxID=57028 RepID=A0A2W7RXK6_9BACT|nr:hypothetical protein LV84_01147 [Algoriphagus ratkowskyi]